MKDILFYVAALFMATSIFPLHAPDMQGYWQGKLEWASMSRPLCLQITSETDDGNFQCTLTLRDDAATSCRGTVGVNRIITINLEWKEDSPLREVTIIEGLVRADGNRIIAGSDNAVQFSADRGGCTIPSISRRGRAGKGPNQL